MIDSYNKVFGEKQRIMFVFAHPDDAEIYAGGTVSRLVKDGKKVKLVKMTTGNKGSRGVKISEDELATLRESEDLEALAVLGLSESDSVNLNLGDGTVENSLKTIEKLVLEIRLFKPDILITHNPETPLIRDLEGFYYVNHRDHRNTALSVVDAAYPYSNDLLFFPDQLVNGVTGHKVSEFLFVDSWGHPDTIFVEITDFAEQRTKAISTHKSQYSMDDSKVSTDYFAPLKDGQRFEQFRHVVAD